MDDSCNTCYPQTRILSFNQEKKCVLYHWFIHFVAVVVFFFFSFFLCRTVPTAYGHSQARVWIRAVAAGRPTPQPQPQQCGIWYSSVTYTTAYGNATSLTHWAELGIKPTSSWILVGFATTEQQQELLIAIIFMGVTTYIGFSGRTIEEMKFGKCRVAPELNHPELEFHLLHVLQFTSIQTPT